MGGLIFVDVRDRSGIVQAVFNPDFSSEAIEIADKLRNEFVIELTGKVVERAEGQKNPKVKTGSIEIQVDEVEHYQ